LRAALRGALEDIPYRHDPVFGLSVPEQVPGVPPEVLTPRTTWADPAAYDIQARRLAGMFTENFERIAIWVSAEIRAGGPRT
jgi:phosphoenolpyruvate carboxykinase (ATP)